MTIKRKQLYAIRSNLYETDLAMRLEKGPEAERQRDLVANASIALWELDTKRLVSCLRRLVALDSKWASALSMVLEVARPGQLLAL